MIQSFPILSFFFNYLYYFRFLSVYHEPYSFYDSREPTRLYDSHEHTRLYDNHEHTRLYDSLEPTPLYDSHEPTPLYHNHEPTRLYDSHEPTRFYGSHEPTGFFPIIVHSVRSEVMENDYLNVAPYFSNFSINNNMNRNMWQPWT